MSTQELLVIFSTTSRNSTAGLRPRVAIMRERDIVAEAENELARAGRSFEEMAGIDFIGTPDGDIRPQRDLSPDEITALAIEKLGDDGRIFFAFDQTPEGMQAFDEVARLFGIGHDADGLMVRINERPRS